MRPNIFLLTGALAASATASLIRRAGVSSNLPSGWSYQGCYTDNVPNRVLTGASYADGSGMTEESCISFCSQRGFSFAGVEYAQECYCDYQLANASTLQPDSDCSMTCAGDSTEACGAGNRLTVFSNGGGPPVTNPGPNGWESLGCYTDSSSKTLVNYPKADQNSSAMTVATCTSACQASGYTYAGLEYGGECYCGFWISNDGAPASSDGCSITCNGNHSEFCGGSNRLNLYQLPNETYPATSNLPDGWSALGCWTDSVQNRTLVTGEPVPGGYTNMTIENCLQVCQSNGFALAGVEYSQECFCGNQVSNGGVCADPQTCNMPCRGNVNEICGGSDRLNMFQYGSGTVSACAGVPTSTSSIVSVASSTSVSSSTSVPSSGSASTTSIPVSTSVDSSSSFSSTITTTTTLLTSSSTPVSSAPSSTSVPTSTTTAPVSPSSSSFSTSTIPTTSTDSSSTSTIFTTSTTTVPLPTSTTTTTSVPSTTSTTSTASTTSIPTSTSAPVTVLPTTSTTVATVATSSSTTVSACTPTTTSSGSFGSVINGGFENGLLPWIPVTNLGSVSVNISNNALAFAGCQALFILPTSSPGTVRQVTISQALTPVLVPGRVYTLTMYQGRVTSASTGSNPSIAIRFGTTTITVGPSCNGATCTVKGESGTVWQRIVVPFVAPVVSTPVQFVITWTDSNPNMPILLDEISVK